MRQFLVAAVLLLPQLLVGQKRPAFIPDNESYLWPTNASENVSATFGETRARHFHAGIDVKTWGKSGFDVYATRDGIIWRLVVLPDGYGKMVVMKHNDGSFSAYAHLDDFEQQLQQVADSIRLVQNKGSMDTTFTTRRMFYRKGDRIAYSGATGIGPPHLHFELRSPLNRPFNPLLAGISMPDKIPPQFSLLGAECLDPDGQVDGRGDFVTRKAVFRKGFYDFGTIKAHGTIGLSVVAFDQANGAGGNTYAVYEFATEIEGRRLFQARADSFSFEQTGQMFLDRVYPLLRGQGLFLQRLWIRDGNTVPFYDRLLGKGLIKDDGGRHTVIITAKDFSGNSKQARVVIDFSKGSPGGRVNGYKPVQGRETGGLIEQSLVVNTSDWTRFHWPDNTRFYTFELPLTGSRRHKEQEVVYHAKTVDFMATNRGRHAYFFRILPGSASEIQLPDQQLRVRFAAHSVYDTLLVGLETFTFKGHPAFYLHPENEPTAGQIQVEMILPPDAPGLSTYRLYHLSPRWASFRSRESWMDGSILYGKINDFGLHVAMPDTSAPIAGSPGMFKNLRGVWHLSASVRDDLSGIDDAGSWIEWNGITGVTEYDAEKARLIFKHPQLKPGAGKPVSITVTDRSGNRRVFSYKTR